MPDIFSDPFLDFTNVDPMSVLPHLIGERSWLIPNLLEIADDDMVWLRLRVDEWPLLKGYKKISNYVKGLLVTNDSAERGVSLIQNFVSRSTDEELRQDILLAVQDHREKFPVEKMLKSSLTDM